MTASTLSEINRQNATHSTGPKTETGKQISSMNAFRHGLSGNHLLLQPHEHEAYTRLTSALTREYAPATESESQFVQKIIDCHTRLNRIAAIENNILSVGVTRHTNPDSTPDSINDATTESMIAQAAAWAAEAGTFDKLSRYESRISRQLIQYTKELDRIQTARKQARTERENQRHPIEIKPNTTQSASFRQTPLIHHVADRAIRNVTPIRTPQPASAPDSAKSKLGLS